MNVESVKIYVDKTRLVQIEELSDLIRDSLLYQYKYFRNPLYIHEIPELTSGDERLKLLELLKSQDLFAELGYHGTCIKVSIFPFEEKKKFGFFDIFHL